MFYIKIIDNNQDARVIEYFSTIEFSRHPSLYQENEIELLDKYLDGLNCLIGKTVRDGVNYVTDLFLKDEKGEYKRLTLLNSVIVYVMNEQGKTIDSF